MRTRRTAANPYLPAETNPFGQQENPFVPMNENIEQGIAPTEPEGPRVVTAPQTPQTAKPRGEVVTMDATLRMKVAVVCESCGQRGMLRLGQVSERTRCRCGSAHVELLEASRKTARNLVWEVAVIDRFNHQEFAIWRMPNETWQVNLEKYQNIVDWYVWRAGPRDEYDYITVVDQDAVLMASGEEPTVEEAKAAAEAALFARTKTHGRKRASRKTAYFLEGDDWDYVVDPDGDGLMVVLLEDGQVVDSVGGVDVSYWISDHGNVHIRDPYEDYEYVKSIALEMREQRTGSRRYAEKECTCWEGYERVPGTEPCASGSCRKKQARRTASVWIKSLNPHHFYKTVVKDGYELNLFASDVDYRWTVDVMVAGNSSTLELFEQGVSASLEEAKREAEQSAQFFQG